MTAFVLVVAVVMVVLLSLSLLQVVCEDYLGTLEGGPGRSRGAGQLKTLQLLTSMQPQVAELFLRVQFTHATDQCMLKPETLQSAEVRQRALLQELDEIIADSFNYGLTAGMVTVAKRLLFVQHRHCSMVHELVRSSPEDLRRCWHRMVKAFHSHINNQVLCCRDGSLVRPTPSTHPTLLLPLTSSLPSIGPA